MTWHPISAEPFTGCHHWYSHWLIEAWQERDWTGSSLVQMTAWKPKAVMIPTMSPLATYWHNGNDWCTETEMSPFWRIFHHRLHWKLSFWQLSVPSVMKISSKWWHFAPIKLASWQLSVFSSMPFIVNSPSVITITTISKQSASVTCDT